MRGSLSVGEWARVALRVARHAQASREELVEFQSTRLRRIVRHAWGPAAEGERGKVVATGLHAFAMPFIRYHIGDLVTRGAQSCRCGQPFSMLRAIDGRAAHYLSLVGRSVHPFEVTGRLLQGDVSWIDRHQLAQEREDAVVLRIAPLAAPPAGALERIEKIGRSALGAGVRFRVELVDSFPLDPSGKFRSYVALGDP